MKSDQVRFSPASHLCEEILEWLQGLGYILRVDYALRLKVDSGEDGVTQFDKAGAEVAQLLRRLVTPVLLFVRLAHEVVLPGQVPHDGAALAQLRLTIDKIWEIREIQSQSEFFFEPAFAAELRPVGDFVQFVFEFDFCVSKHQANGLSQTADFPIS